jgi:hypothetical protein
MDVMLAIVLALLLLMMMMVAVVKQQHAQRQMAAMRASVRNTEDALLALQTGNAAPREAHVETLTDTAPAGYHWVRVTMPPSNALPAASLVGLVPQAKGGSR